MNLLTINQLFFSKLLKGIPGKDGLDGPPGNDGAMVCMTDCFAFIDTLSFNEQGLRYLEELQM